MRGKKNMTKTDLQILIAALETLQEVREEHGDELANEIENTFSAKLSEKEKKPASSKK